MPPRPTQAKIAALEERIVTVGGKPIRTSTRVVAAISIKKRGLW